MSTQKGNTARRRAPAHQNKVAFKHNRNSRTTKMIAEIPIGGLCGTCTRQMEWRKQYRKFKPMKHARKCNACRQPTVVHAYHVICPECAENGGRSKLSKAAPGVDVETRTVCAKCLKPKFDKTEGSEDEAVDEEILDILNDPERLRGLLAGLPESRRRAVLRAVDQGDLPLAIDRLVALGVLQREDDGDDTSSDGERNSEGSAGEESAGKEEDSDADDM